MAFCFSTLLKGGKDSMKAVEVQGFLNGETGIDYMVFNLDHPFLPPGLPGGSVMKSV